MSLPKKPAAPRRAAPPPARPEGERLSKRVAQLKACSRREAEQFIEGGWVMVDGRVVEEPMARVSTQTVTMDPEASLMDRADVTLLLHKPPGFDTMATPGQAGARLKPAQLLLQAASHAAHDPAGTRVLKQHLSRLSPGVPLETAASGLVVFTQDWRVLRKLTEDAAFIEHEFLVEVQGQLDAQTLQRLNTLALREALPPFKASVNSTGDNVTRLRVAIKGTHPGLIAYLCEQVQLHITAIKRQRIGRVALTQLPLGQWRFLGLHERF